MSKSKPRGRELYEDIVEKNTPKKDKRTYSKIRKKGYRPDKGRGTRVSAPRKGGY